MSNDANDVVVKSKGIEIITSYTRPANATPYTSGDVIGPDWEFSSKGEINMLYIMSVILRIDAGSLPSGMTTFKLHLYNSNTTVQLADNAVMTFLIADKEKYKTTIDLDAPVDKGDFLFSRTEGLNIPIKLTDGKLYGRLETVGGYTPSSGAIKSISLIGVGL